MGRSTSERISAISRAVKILDVLTLGGSRGLSLTEISDALKMHKPTVLRTLETLVEEQLAERDPETNRYRLGLRLLFLGFAVQDQMEIPERARPFLEELSALTGETVHLCAFDDGQVVYVDKIESPQAIRLYSRIGRRAPVHCTAVGKVLMADLSADERRKIIERRGLKAYTRNTITDFLRFEQELETVRATGVGFDREEHEEGIACIAAPIRDYSRRVRAAVSVTAPTFRTPPERFESFVPLVKRIAMQISERCGYRP